MFPFKASEPIDINESKRIMIERHLKGRDIWNPEVLRAMEAVPREEFISSSFSNVAYDDGPLSIGQGQTISQPYIVALMVQELELEKEDRVLEIGAGSGYQAAVLSLIAAHVYTSEIVEFHAKRSADRLKRMGYANVTVRHSDGSMGWEEEAPFEKIISAAAARKVPLALENQLKEGGILVTPVGGGYSQDLVKGVKVRGRMEYKLITAVRFVPMTGAAAED